MNNWTLTLVSVVTGLLAFGIAAAADIVNVTQSNRSFTPDKVAIKAGDMVRIRNDDTVIHHLFVDQPDMQFDSGEQPVAKTVDISFPKPGTFDVLCAIHPRMKLTVTVQ